MPPEEHDAPEAHESQSSQDADFDFASLMRGKQEADAGADDGDDISYEDLHREPPAKRAKKAKAAPVAEDDGDAETAPAKPAAKKKAAKAAAAPVEAGEDEAEEEPGETEEEADQETDAAKAKDAKTPFTYEQLAERDKQSRAALKEARRLQRESDEKTAQVVRNFETLLTHLQNGGQFPAAKPQAGAPETPQRPRLPPEIVEALKNDPEAVVGAMLMNQLAHERAAQQRQAQEQQIAQYNELARQTVQWGRGVEEEFKEENPDYDAAAEHYVAVKTQELMLGGLSPQAAHQQVANMLVTAFAQARANRQNPAALLYQAAKLVGFAGAPRVQAGEDDGEDESEEEAVTPAQKLAMRKQGAAAARSQGKGGAGKSGALTGARLLEMDDDAFGENLGRFLKGMSKGQRPFAS